MNKEHLKIISSQKIAKKTYKMVLKSHFISSKARPGQFLHIQVQGFTLRRPISIAHVEREKGELTIIFKVFGEGTKALAKKKAGAVINVLGPNGSSFPNLELKKALLIGGGVGVPPIYFLGHELIKDNIHVTSLLGFQNKESIFYKDQFQKLGKTMIATDDGSYGHHGFVTDLLNKITDFDYYFACGPFPMLRSVKELLKEKEGFLSLEERMGCGVGACFACVIPTDHKGGYRKICQDGPVFQAKEIIL